MEVRPKYDLGDNGGATFLRTLGFIYDKPSKYFVKIITNKIEAQKLIKHLSSMDKFYVIEHHKVLKRKRSEGFNKAIERMKNNNIRN